MYSEQNILTMRPGHSICRQLGKKPMFALQTFRFLLAPDFPATAAKHVAR